MNRYRNVPGLQGQSKATPTTLCQKCLKKDMFPSIRRDYYNYTDLFPRHYSYECKSTLQDRPYNARPSRTQQLSNPRLLPKLSSDTPNDLLRTKGVADEQLARKVEEREHKREDLDVDSRSSAWGNPRKRARSISSESSASVSTISTNRSESPVSAQRNRSSRPTHQSGWRRRTDDTSADESDVSSDSMGRQRINSNGDERSTRRRRRSQSPSERGRRYDSDRRRNSHRSQSRDKRKTARNRQSEIPSVPYDDRSLVPQHRGRFSEERRTSHPNKSSSYKQASPRRERSLSPFSKRLALTQAMNMGK